jgi:hypothetical protein
LLLFLLLLPLPPLLNLSQALKITAGTDEGSGAPSSLLLSSLLAYFLAGSSLIGIVQAGREIFAWGENRPQPLLLPPSER